MSLAHYSHRLIFSIANRESLALQRFDEDLKSLQYNLKQTGVPFAIELGIDGNTACWGIFVTIPAEGSTEKNINLFSARIQAHINSCMGALENGR